MGDLTLWLVGYLLVFAAISWRNLRVGSYLILMALPLYLIKFKFGPIPTTLLELMIYTATLVWLIKVWRGRAVINWSALRYQLIPLLLIALGLILGTMVSSDRAISLGIIKGWFFDPLLLFMLLTSNLDRQLHIKQAIAALLVPAGVLSVLALYQVATGQFITVDARASAVFSSANYLSLFVVPVLVLGAGLIFSIARRWRGWLVFVWLVTASALYFTFSYAGWLGLLIGLSVLVLCLSRWWVVAAGLIGVLGLALLSQWQHPKFQQMLDLAGRSSSHVRLQVWQTALSMIKEHPLTGIGLGLFEKRYLEFAEKLFHPPLELRMLHSHNIVLQFLVNAGLFGALGFIWLVVNFFRLVLWQAVVNRGLLAATTLAAMTALLAHGLLDLAYWKNDLSVLFWTIMAFGTILNQLSDYDRSPLHHRP